MEYEIAVDKVHNYLRDLGYDNLNNLIPLDDDIDAYNNTIYRWSFVVEDIDYSIEYYVSNETIDFYDCLNA